MNLLTDLSNQLSCRQKIVDLSSCTMSDDSDIRHQQLLGARLRLLDARLERSVPAPAREHFYRGPDFGMSDQ